MFDGQLSHVYAEHKIPEGKIIHIEYEHGAE